VDILDAGDIRAATERRISPSGVRPTGVLRMVWVRKAFERGLQRVTQDLPSCSGSGKPIRIQGGVQTQPVAPIRRTLSAESTANER
jgi:hypothetical protein